MALDEMDHSLINQFLMDSEENLNRCTEKMQTSSPYNWSNDWNFWISSSSYKYKNEEFKRQFSHLPDLERLVVDYACALQKDILLQGRLYLSENWLCFYSNIFRWETTISIALKDITFMTKEKTARLIPNAIQIATEGEKFFFTSFSARDRSYLHIFRLWQNALLEKVVYQKSMHCGTSNCNQEECMECGDPPLLVKTLLKILARKKVPVALHTNRDLHVKVLAFYKEQILLDSKEKLTKQEFWQLVQQSYGSELGLNTEEMENIYASSEENGQLNFGDESGEKETPKTVGVMREPPAQTFEAETESLNGNTLTEDTDPEEAHCDKEERHFIFPSEVKTADVVHHKCSRQSPDLNENSPEEKGSASETDGEVEENIPDRNLHGKLFVDRVFHIGADRMFEMLFTNSYFMQRYHNARNITDLVSSPWNTESGGNQQRTMTYTIIFNNPFYGKFTTATEKQVLLKRSYKDPSYWVQAEVATHDVPYHEYFYTVYSYCVAPVSSQKCKLRISADVKYKKQPWGLVKTLIEKNTWSRMQENFKQLESELLMEQYSISKTIEDPGKLAALRKRRWTLQRNMGEMLPKCSAQYPSPNTDAPSRGDVGSKKDATNKTIIIIVVMSIFLLLLVLLNVTLFLKLSKIEHAAQSFYRVHVQEEGSSNLALNVASREKTPRHSTDQVQHMKGVLKDSIELLEQLKNSLYMLQNSFDHLNKTRSRKPES